LVGNLVGRQFCKVSNFLVGYFSFGDFELGDFSLGDFELGDFSYYPQMVHFDRTSGKELWTLSEWLCYFL